MSNLWDGVSFKLDMALFYLNEMRQDLIPATTRQDYVYYQNFTVPPVNLWAPKFYYHLDAFLAATRSVDLVITTTFGVDNNKKMKKWIATLPAHEQDNRAVFQSQYDAIAAAFRDHLLTHIRNVSIHRSGMPQVEVGVLGRWGEHYRGGPTQSLPTFDQPKQLTPSGPDDPLSWMQPVRFAIDPKQDEFFVQEVLPGGSSRDHPLFTSCEAYLMSAVQLVADAKSLVARVHTHPLTPPPLYDV